MPPQCPLCFNGSDTFAHSNNRDDFRCSYCQSIFADPKTFLNYEDEKSRYETHNNDVLDPGYRNFMKPIVDIVSDKFTQNHIGLDYGSGTGPVVSKMLHEKGFRVEQFDPIFCNKPEVLTKSYDYIVCCEVIEHFYNPHKEFLQLRAMLNPGGGLFCMTHIYIDSIDFRKWYYKNDSTHVFFYHPLALSYIKEQFQFGALEVNSRTIHFSV